MRALAEGAVLGGYDPRGRRGVERFVLCGAGDDLRPWPSAPALVGRWTNAARALVDAPPNVLTPQALAERATAIPRSAPRSIDGAEAGSPR